MWTGGTAGGTGVAENVATLNGCAGSGDEAGHVEIHGFEPLAVIDADSIAEYVELFRERDGARSHCADGFAFGRALVYATVIFTSGLSAVETLNAER